MARVVFRTEKGPYLSPSGRSKGAGEETAWFQPLHLKCDLLVSKIWFFEFNLYRYTEERIAAGLDDEDEKKEKEEKEAARKEKRDAVGRWCTLTPPDMG